VSRRGKYGMEPVMPSGVEVGQYDPECQAFHSRIDHPELVVDALYVGT
jgi:hypothetical protein